MGKSKQAKPLAKLLLDVPFLRLQFGCLQLFAFLLLIAPATGAANHFCCNYPLMGAITYENSSARAANCDKTKGAGRIIWLIKSQLQLQTRASFKNAEEQAGS